MLYRNNKMMAKHFVGMYAAFRPPRIYACVCLKCLEIFRTPKVMQKILIGEYV